jgi:heat shock protein HslJ
VVDPDLPLVGTHWVLDAIVDGDAVSSVPDGVEAFVDLDDASNLSLFDGCNGGSGPVEVGDGELQIGTINATRTGCGSEAEQLVSDAFGRVLVSGTAVEFEVDADRLAISNDGRGLVFRAA